MKKVIPLLLFSFFGLATVSQAQVVKKAAHGVKTGAKKVGNKTAELATISKAKITDKKVKDRTGPNGETIYVDDGTKYYWIDKKGKRHFISESSLKTKI